MTMKVVSLTVISPARLAGITLLTLLGLASVTGRAEAAGTCSASYCVGQCARGCNDPELGGAFTTCENWLKENGVQGDTDGVDNWIDNCVCKNNANQADCDDDGKGNVCDTLNGVFQAVDRWRACASDRDDHVGYFEIEVTEHRQYNDISSCNSAPRWNQREWSSWCTLNLDEIYCCEQAVSNEDDLFICHPVGQYSCNPDTIP